MRFDASKLAFKVYRYTLGPAMHLLAGPGNGCRYLPSCSRYAEEALRVHGPAMGLFLAARRIARCHPWGSSGWDPVPAPRASSRRQRQRDVISGSDLKG